MSTPKPLMLSLLDLTEATCKWPIGHPREAGFGFCGHPKTPFVEVYCVYHKRLAYVPVPKRRRARGYVSSITGGYA